MLCCCFTEEASAVHRYPRRHPWDIPAMPRKPGQAVVSLDQDFLRARPSAMLGNPLILVHRVSPALEGESSEAYVRYSDWRRKHECDSAPRKPRPRYFQGGE